VDSGPLLSRKKFEAVVEVYYSKHICKEVFFFKTKMHFKASLMILLQKDVIMKMYLAMIIMPVLKMTAVKILDVTTSQSPVMIKMHVQLILVTLKRLSVRRCRL